MRASTKIRGINQIHNLIDWNSHANTCIKVNVGRNNLFDVTIGYKIIGVLAAVETLHHPN